jgi:hypothetical protein
MRTVMVVVAQAPIHISLHLFDTLVPASYAFHTEVLIQQRAL